MLEPLQVSGEEADLVDEGEGGVVAEVAVRVGLEGVEGLDGGFEEG